MVVQLLWLSGRALAAQARGVLGSTPGDCRLFHFPLFSPHFIYIVVRLCVYCWQVLSESGNSMEMNVLTKSIEEIEAKIQPQNKKYVYQIL